MTNLITLPSDVHSKIIATIISEGHSWFHGVRLEVCQIKGLWTYDILGVKTEIPLKESAVNRTTVNQHLDARRNCMVIASALSFSMAISYAHAAQEAMIKKGYIEFGGGNPRGIPSLHIFATRLNRPLRPSASSLLSPDEVGDFFLGSSPPFRQHRLTT